jgi:hypothetical protein
MNNNSFDYDKEQAKYDNGNRCLKMDFTCKPTCAIAACCITAMLFACPACKCSRQKYLQKQGCGEPIKL